MLANRNTIKACRSEKQDKAVLIKVLGISLQVILLALASICANTAPFTAIGIA